MSEATDILREHGKFLESIDMQETADSMRRAANAIDRLTIEHKVIFMAGYKAAHEDMCIPFVEGDEDSGAASYKEWQNSGKQT